MSKLGSCVFGIALIQASNVFAQAAPRGEEEVIIVTAQKREQRVDKVAIAVTAIGQAGLDKAGVSGADGLIGLVPNFNYASSDASGRITIRGVGTESTNPGADPGVAFHIDGIYVPRFYGVEQAAFFDVDRVEVLRAPQGTLFGRNATGGAINVLSAKPSAEKIAFGDVQVGSFEQLRTRLTLGGAVGAAKTRLSIQQERTGGFLRSVGAGENLLAKDDLSIRGQIGFDFAQGSGLTLRATYAHRGGQPGGQVPLEPFNTADGIYFTPFTQAGVVNQGPYAGRYPALNIALQDPFKTDQSGSDTDIEQWQFSSELKLDLGFADLKVIAGHSVTDFFVSGDADRSGANLGDFSDDQGATSTSAEIQLVSAASSKLEWILGAYGLADNVDRILTVNAPATPQFCANPANPRFAACVRVPFQNKVGFSTLSLAGFGEAAWPVNDSLKIRLGLRYTSDDRSEVRVNQSTNGTQTPRWIDKRFDAITGKLGFDYELGNGGFVYGHYSRGFKSGGFEAAGTYEPEFVDALETGVKMRIGRALKLGLTAFHYTYKDQQLRFLVGQQIDVENADSTIWGAELEANFRPLQKLNIQTTLGYLDATIDRFSGIDPILPALGVRNAKGNRLSNAPEFSGQVAISYDVNFASGASLTPRISTRYQSTQYRTPFNNALDRVEGHSRTDARLLFASANDLFTLEAFVENIENDAILSFVEAGSVFNGNIATGSYQSPRTWGVRFGFKYRGG